MRRLSNTDFYGQTTTAGIRCVIFFGHKLVFTTSATPFLEWHFIFASQVKKPVCKSIFHTATAITDAQWGTETYSKRQNVFTMSGVCYPGGAICLWHITGSFSDAAEEEFALFSHNSESNILNKVKILNLYHITCPSICLATVISSYCLTHSIFRQWVTVFVLLPPSFSCINAEGACRPTAAWVADWGLGLQLAHANHVDYCDYRPFPPLVSRCNLLTWIWQKVPVAIGDLSSCSPPSKSSPPTLQPKNAPSLHPPLKHNRSLR